MKEFFMPIVLQLAGVFVIFAEIFLPSGGLLSVVALGLFGYSLFIVFHDISTMAGTYFVLADLVIIPMLVMVGLKVLARSPATLRGTLSREKGVVSQAPELAGFMGGVGKAITDLHPGGTAMINDKRLDVVSRGEYIDKDTDIVVVEVTGNQIIVKEQLHSASIHAE